MERDIGQIMPAPDWVAVLLVDTPPYYAVMPLVCWAVVHKAGKPAHVVEGCVAGEGGVVSAESYPTFYRYAYTLTMTEDDSRQWATEGERRVQIVR